MKDHFYVFFLQLVKNTNIGEKIQFFPLGEGENNP